MPGLIRLSEHQAERRREGAKFRFNNEREVDLERIVEEKYAVRPRASHHVNMVQGPVLIVHVRCEVREDAGEIRGSVDAKCEVYIRPLIFAPTAELPTSVWTA